MLPGSYEVGFAKPPAGTQFRKGQSGNPRGRPKGARNKMLALHEERLKEIVLGEAYRDIKVHDGDRQVTVPMAEAIIRSIALKAAKGDHRSQKLFTEILGQVERDRKAQRFGMFQATVEYKISAERELEQYAKLGITPPELVPHPDDIEINLDTGDITFYGPRTAQEFSFWTILAQRRDAAREEIKRCKASLLTEIDHETRQTDREILEDETEIFDRISESIGIWPNRDPVARLRYRREIERKSIAKKRSGGRGQA